MARLFRTVRALSVTVLAALLLGGACPGKKNGSSSSGGPADANFVLDGGCVIIGYNCSQVGSCAEPCGADQNCVDSCQAAGCETGNATFQAIRSCTINKCWTRCLNGSTPDCNACSAEKCVSESQACDNNTCPIACATADGGLPDAAVPVRDAGTTLKDCRETYACMGTCLVETPFLCIGVCKNRACPSAQTALDTLLECARTTCRAAPEGRCNGRFSTADCQACMEEKCVTQWAACTANGC